MLWIWDSKCIPKIKFFSWLLFNDRLNTRNILKKKKVLDEGYNCALCHSGCEETMEHLFLTAPLLSAGGLLLVLHGMMTLMSFTRYTLQEISSQGLTSWKSL
jgi:queuine/archaeosine tRNA-ribosyltransferase